MSNLTIYEGISPIQKLSKSEIVGLANRQIDEINDSGSAEKAYAFLHKITTLCDLVKKGIVESAINEIEKGNDSAFGIKLSKASKSTYDYSNDEIHVKLKAEISDREQLLKALKGKFSFLDETTGEVIELRPPIRKVSDYIKTEF